jgi:cell division protein FtsQ
VLGALLALGLVLAVGWLWGRNSSLVAIRQVTISGVSGSHAARIDAALRRAARGMTTLNFNAATLDAAVHRYNEVRSISASTHFPHGLTIRVDEQLPLAEVVVSGRPVVIASDGNLIQPPPRGDHRLPVIPLGALSTGASPLSEPGVLDAVRVLAAAPWQLIPHIRQAANSADHGVIAILRNGPRIYFGDATGLRAKWLAAIAVLSSHRSAGASYVDVSDPQRPAAGVSAAATTSTTASLSSSAVGGTGAVTTPASATVPAAGSAVTPATGSATAPASGSSSATGGTAGGG